MDPTEPQPDGDLASFYDIAANYGDVEEQEISPSLHAISQISTRYQSSEFIAKGGMKQVFKVHDARCKRDVAMATLHDDAPAELFDPLIHEAWLTAQLDHPNIITIHDVGVDDRERPYFTMDLKTGDSLADLIEKLSSENSEASRRYPLTSLLQMFVKICDAVGYAHSESVLHLDLKPANIQVGEFGEVLVCDWGLGRMLRGEEGIEFERLLLNSDLLSSGTLFGQVRGTPGFIAPEQISKDGDRDSRTDIYQLGCILYSLLTLDRPVDGEPEEALQKAVEGQITRPRDRAPDRNIPASLEAVALKAMSVDPSQRYQSVASLSEEVDRYLTGFATEAEHAGVLTQIGLLYKRNKRFCLTVITCAGLMLYGAIWSYLILAGKERVASDARDKAERSLALYNAGRGERDMLSSQNAESVERAVIELHLAGEASRPEQLLQAALDNEPSNSVYLRAMGEHYFIMQRFSEAVKYLDGGEKRNEADRLVGELAKEYAALKPDDDQPLTTVQVVNLLRRITDFNGFEAMILLNDQANRTDPNERATIIEEHLRSINPNWKNGTFVYDFAAGRLRIGGKGMERLSESGSILSGLKPRRLKLSGTSIRELWKETDYAIETLDIRGCPIDDPSVLQRMLHLKTLIIVPEQFSAKELAALPDWVEIVEKTLPADSAE